MPRTQQEMIPIAKLPGTRAFLRIKVIEEPARVTQTVIRHRPVGSEIVQDFAPIRTSAMVVLQLVKNCGMYGPALPQGGDYVGPQIAVNWRRFRRPVEG